MTPSKPSTTQDSSKPAAHGPNVRETTSAPAGSSERAIGRPEEWREGRYEKPGAPTDASVLAEKSAGGAKPHIQSSPVTQDDYRQADQASGPDTTP